MSTEHARGKPVGLQPYPTGRPLYGRDWERGELASLLFAERILLLYSPSGAGKTSLVQAGLIPDLRDERGLRVLDPVRVHIELPAWARGDASQGQASGVNRYRLSTLFSLGFGDAARPNVGLLNIDLRKALRDLADAKPQPLVVIFDQFEQLLTSDPGDLAAKHEFFADLGAALTNRKIWAIFVIREDFLAALDPYLGYIPNRLRARFRLDLLEQTGAHEVLISTAAEAQATFTPGAADLLVNELRRIKPAAAGEAAPAVGDLGLYVEPVYLQVVYERIWLGCRLGEGGISAITDDHVRQYGDVDTALAEYYDRRIAEVSALPGASQRILRSWIEERLITPDGLRDQVRRGVEESAGLAAALVQGLLDTYLVRAETRGGLQWLELAHDRLIQPVLKSNAAWREANTRPFQRQAVLWATQRNDSLLLRDDELARARAWAARYPAEITAGDREFLDESLQAAQRRAAQQRRTNLEDLGWGVIFPTDADVEVVRALKPLLDHRRAQAGSRFRRFAGDDGQARPGESAEAFLDRFGVSFGAIDHRRVPYYLLIVGDPERIPFQFQYDLAPQYAVGRIAFDTAEEYRRYAEGVVAAETGQARPDRRITIVGAAHTLDPATEQMHALLLHPLYNHLRDAGGWPVQAIFEQDLTGSRLNSIQGVATRARLKEELSGATSPALLFTAGLGLNLPPGHERQLAKQGALVCADWPGFPPIRLDQCFCGEDLDDQANVAGMIGFLFAGFGAGTSRIEDTRSDPNGPIVNARQDFLSRLPQRMLSHPNGGALAVISHVNLNWVHSFRGTNGQSDISLYTSLFERLTGGWTVGAAMEAFTQRSVRGAMRLADTVTAARRGEQQVADVEIDALITARVDLRNYIILGDPAVRLLVDDLPAAQAAGSQPQGAAQEAFEPTVPAVLGLDLAALDPATVHEIAPAGADASAPLIAKGQHPPTARWRGAEAALPTPPPDLRKGLPQMDLPEDDDLLVFNGIDGVTGGYAMPPITPAEAARMIRGETLKIDDLRRLDTIQKRRSTPTLGWPDGVRLEDPRQAGWALVTHVDEDPQVVSALLGLFEHRRAQIGNDKIVKHLQVRPEEAASADYAGWLKRHNVGAGSPNPRLVPCYLLIAGSPALIPFAFSQGLISEYAVGRLHFDTVVEYRAYIDSLIAHEAGGPPTTAREVCYFATQHAGDKATARSLQRMVRPLAGLPPVDDQDDPIGDLDPPAARNGFAQRLIAQAEATRPQLGAILAPPAGQLPPALLFTAGHGMVFPRGHPLQRRHQGALLCAEWSGQGERERAMYFAAEDLPGAARLRGMVAFCFACFGGGTPPTERFLRVESVPRELTDTPFIADLPRAMLTHPNGGALACIAHIERAWISSFRRKGVFTQLAPFDKAIDRILRGHPVGYALGDFGDRYARLSIDLANQLFTIRDQGPGAIDESDLTWTWVERNDAEGYVVIGDPAARLDLARVAGG